jgi:glyoxylase-like metal-dependent hydrolase (beta-lactamase superfamily II)
MNLVPLADNAYHLRAGSNAGLLVDPAAHRALLVDTGLDRDAARRILKHVDALGVELAAVLITHAHADHFGGAHDIKRRTGATVLAPAFEAAIVENPLLEPTYLYAGARPIRELQDKFILAPACQVDSLLRPGRQQFHGFDLEILPAPGHAHNQVMVGWPQAGICFAADAYFPPQVLDKYGIPFYVDVDQTLNTLAALPALPYRLFAQGHGDAYPHDQLAAALDYNRQRILAVRQATLEALDEPREAAQVLRHAAGSLGASITQPAIYYLTRTTIHACLNSLRQAGLADLELRDNRLRWSRV